MNNSGLNNQIGRNTLFANLCSMQICLCCAYTKIIYIVRCNPYFQSYITKAKVGNSVCLIFKIKHETFIKDTSELEIEERLAGYFFFNPNTY